MPKDIDEASTASSANAAITNSSKKKRAISCKKATKWNKFRASWTHPSDNSEPYKTINRKNNHPPKMQKWPRHSTPSNPSQNLCKLSRWWIVLKNIIKLSLDRFPHNNPSSTYRTQIDHHEAQSISWSQFHRHASICPIFCSKWEKESCRPMPVAINTSNTNAYGSRRQNKMI